MKKCMNCNAKNRDTDKYCRNCGCLLKNSFYYIVINILIILFVIIILFTVILFIASYFVR